MSNSEGRPSARAFATRAMHGIRRRVKPPLMSADDSVHRLAGMTVSTYDKSYPVVIPLHPDCVEVLGDPSFSESCREIRNLTMLDTPRLANLWQLSRMCTGGSILEVGSYLGGSALHLSNGSPERRVIVCEAFGASFDALTDRLDGGFNTQMFTENRRDDVEALFTDRGRDVLILDGFFPESAEGHDLGPLSFAHVDVDVYEATRDTLAFIARLMSPRSLIVLDDHRRTAHGVDRAVEEFTAANPAWIALPLFPAQAVLIPNSWFD